jgi:hypothetical protein
VIHRQLNSASIVVLLFVALSSVIVVAVDVLENHHGDIGLALNCVINQVKFAFRGGTIKLRAGRGN